MQEPFVRIQLDPIIIICYSQASVQTKISRHCLNYLETLTISNSLFSVQLIVHFSNIMLFAVFLERSMIFNLCLNFNATLSLLIFMVSRQKRKAIRLLLEEALK